MSTVISAMKTSFDGTVKRRQSMYGERSTVLSVMKCPMMRTAVAVMDEDSTV